MTGARRDTSLLVILVWLGFLAGWTFGSVPLTLLGAPFAMLWVALVTGLVGVWLALRARAPLGDWLLTGPTEAGRTGLLSRGRLVLVLVLSLIHI